MSWKKNGKFEEVKTVDGKKLKVLPIGIGVVTCSPPNIMSKSHHSNESKMSSLQLMSNAMSSVAKRLAFTGKHKVKRPHNPDPMKKTKTQSSATGAAAKFSVVKLSTKMTKMKLLQK